VGRARGGWNGSTSVVSISPRITRSIVRCGRAIVMRWAALPKPSLYRRTDAVGSTRRSNEIQRWCSSVRGPRRESMTLSTTSSLYDSWVRCSTVILIAVAVGRP
jgi:hypothetical protein